MVCLVVQTSRFEVQNLKSRDFEHNNGLRIPGWTLQWKGECFNLYSIRGVLWSPQNGPPGYWGVRILEGEPFLLVVIFEDFGVLFFAPHLRSGKYTPHPFFFDQPIAHPGYHRVPWRFHSDDSFFKWVIFRWAKSNFQRCILLVGGFNPFEQF